MRHRTHWFAFLFSVLAPLAWAVGNAGFVVDDWGVFSYVRETYSLTLRSFYPSATFRPLVPLWVGAQAFLLGDHPVLHSVLNVLLFLFGNGILALTLMRLSSPLVGVVYLLVASRSLVSPVFVFSGATFSYINLSFALMMASLFLEVKWIQERCLSARRWWVIGALLWLGLSCYEAMVPLVVWHLLIPHFLGSQNRKELFSLRKAWQNIDTRRALGIVTLVVFLIILHQNVVTPAIGGRQMSRLRPDLKGFLPWKFLRLELRILAQIIRDLGTQAVRAFQLPVSAPFVLGGVSGLLGCLTYLIWPAVSGNRSGSKFQSKWVYLAALSLLASGSGFVLASGVPIDTHGYHSRYLQWIAVSLCIGFALIAGQVQKWPARMLCVLGVFLPALVFMRVAESYARNFRLQDLIVSQAIAKMERGDIPLNGTIAGHLPMHSKNAFWDEPVFLEPWDFSMALRLKSAGRIKFGFVIQPRVELGVGKAGLAVEDWELPLSPMVVMRFCEDSERGMAYVLKQPVSAGEAIRAFGRESSIALCDLRIP